MGLIDKIEDALRFKDTIFLKENSDLQERFNALNKLVKEYPNNPELNNELLMVKKGLEGENEIAYQLKKAHIGMYVLRDVKYKYEDLKAQIDYVIITPYYIYYIECKNLYGNITVDEKGNFIREYNYNGKVIKKGMYSPLRQVEAQREVLRKIWNVYINKFVKLLADSKFEYFRRVLVVAANYDTILNTTNAPDDIKDKVIRADTLVRVLENDMKNHGKNDVADSKKKMEDLAKGYLKLSVKEDIDFYQYYKNQYCGNNLNEDIIRNRLIRFRSEKAFKHDIPAYYVFTNDELEKLLLVKPKTINELKDSKILNDIKVDLHGKEIVDILNQK